MEKFELMASYILPALDSIGKKFELQVKEVRGVGAVKLLKHENQRVYLIDEPFGKNDFNLFLSYVSGEKSYGDKKWAFDYQCVFFKDGENFFKKAFPTYRKTEDKIKMNVVNSVSHYPNDMIKEIIKLSSNELSVNKKHRTITYYQPPKSDKKEGLERYIFNDVKHAANTFTKKETSSKQRFFPEMKENYIGVLQGIENYHHIPAGTQFKLTSNG